MNKCKKCVNADICKYEKYFEEALKYVIDINNQLPEDDIYIKFDYKCHYFKETNCNLKENNSNKILEKYFK